MMIPPKVRVGAWMDRGQRDSSCFVEVGVAESVSVAEAIVGSRVRFVLGGREREASVGVLHRPDLGRASRHLEVVLLIN